MTVIADLQAASFKGVSFLVESEVKTGGKKTVTHEYVNSDSRFTEELGGLPPSFTIEAIVHGDDGIQKRRNLERVLDLPGLGELVHPVYGTLQVKSTTYSVSSNQPNIGQFRFSIKFETSAANVSPAPTGVSASEASKDAGSARTALNDALETQYIEPQIPETLDSAAEKLDTIYETVGASIAEAITGVESLQNKVAEFTKIVRDGRALVFTAVQQPSTLKTALVDLYRSALSVVALPQDLSTAWNSLLDFGFLESTGETNTVPRANEENNRLILNEHTQTTALINLFESAAYTDYSTDVEIDTARATLNDSYQSQVNSGQPLAADPEVRTTLAQLRVTVNKVLDEKEQNIWKVVSISPGRSSMLLTAYRYYGDLDTLDLLQQLNPEVNSANFNQDITAVSQ